MDFIKGQFGDDDGCCTKCVQKMQTIWSCPYCDHDERDASLNEVNEMMRRRQRGVFADYMEANVVQGKVTSKGKSEVQEHSMQCYSKGTSKAEQHIKQRSRSRRMSRNRSPRRETHGKVFRRPVLKSDDVAPSAPQSKLFCVAFVVLRSGVNGANWPSKLCLKKIRLPTDICVAFVI